MLWKWNLTYTENVQSFYWPEIRGKKVFGSFYDHEKATEKNVKITEVVVFKTWDKSGDMKLETSNRFRFEKCIRVAEKLFCENSTHLFTCSREKLGS